MRKHEADDLTTRSAVMVARAAAWYEHHPENGIAPHVCVSPSEDGNIWRSYAYRETAEARIKEIRALSASDAALARAIDRV